MAFDYEFRNSDARNIRKGVDDRVSPGKKKKIIAAVVLILGVLIFYAVGTSVTGFVAYTKDVERGLNEKSLELEAAQASNTECNSNLFNSLQAVETCKTDFKQKENMLVACNDEKNAIKNSQTEIQGQLNTCTSEKDTVKGQYEEILSKFTVQEESFKKIVRNSVREVCCSINDVQNSRERKWSIQSDAITCSDSGEFTINCGTGEGNY